MDTGLRKNKKYTASDRCQILDGRLMIDAVKDKPGIAGYTRHFAGNLLVVAESRRAPSWPRPLPSSLNQPPGWPYGLKDRCPAIS